MFNVTRNTTLAASKKRKLADVYRLTNHKAPQQTATLRDIAEIKGHLADFSFNLAPFKSLHRKKNPYKEKSLKLY